MSLCGSVITAFSGLVLFGFAARLTISTIPYHRARRLGGDFVRANLDRPCQPFEDHRADLPPHKRVHLDGNRFPGAVDRIDNRARRPPPPGSDGEKQDGILGRRARGPRQARVRKTERRQSPQWIQPAFSAGRKSAYCLEPLRQANQRQIARYLELLNRAAPYLANVRRREVFDSNIDGPVASRQINDTARG